MKIKKSMIWWSEKKGTYWVCVVDVYHFIILLCVNVEFVIVSIISSGLLFESLWYIADSSPILSMFFLLSSHFDEKPPGEYFFIRWIFDEIDGINSCLEDDLKGSRIIFFDFDEVKVRKWFFNILLNSIEITLDEIKRNIFIIIIKTFNLGN